LIKVNADLADRRSAKGMGDLEQIQPRHRFLIGLFFHVTWLSGPVLMALYGVAARAILLGRGVEVVSWERGVELLLPFALWAEPPFLVVAVMTRKRLRQLISRDPGAFRTGMAMALGAYSGLVLSHGFIVTGLLLYEGPGGLAEAVYMFMALWMITIPYMIAVTGVGALVGAGLVWVLLRLLNKV